MWITRLARIHVNKCTEPNTTRTQKHDIPFHVEPTGSTNEAQPAQNPNEDEVRHKPPGEKPANDSPPFPPYTAYSISYPRLSKGQVLFKRNTAGV